MIWLISFKSLVHDKGNSKSPFKIIHLNVGQGDSTLIIGTNGKSLLIDTGRRGSEKVIKSRLKQEGIKHLDYVIITHFDADHYQAFAYLDNLVNQTTLVCDRSDNPPVHKTRQKTYQDYQAKLMQVTYCVLGVGELPWDLGEDIQMTVHAVNGHLSNGDKMHIHNNENAASVGLKITYGDFDYVVSGDLTSDQNGKPDMESPFSALIGDVDVMRVNHHGSHTSTSADYVNTIKPEVAIISVGGGAYAKRYQHPRAITLENLAGRQQENVVDAIYMTNAGFPDRPLGHDIQQKIWVSGGDINVTVFKDHYYVNGHFYKTDGLASELK